MAHENLKVHLLSIPGQSFILSLTHQVYSWSNRVPDKYINYRMFEEVTIREEATKSTRLNLDNRPHYRFDCIFYVEPGYRSLNQRQVYTVGVELKNSKADLMADDKMDHYIGYTDFFFIGVPSELVNDAIQRARENADEQIGVFSVDDGKIHLMPRRIRPTVEHERDLLQQIMYSQMFTKDFKDVVAISLDDIEVFPASLKDIVTKEEDASELYTATNPSYTGNTIPTIAQDKEADKVAAKEKEQLRRERHDAKVSALKEEVSAMNEEIPPVIASILTGLSLGDQRVYHAIRRHGGIQAQNIAGVLPRKDDIEQPSLATVKRSIAALSKVGLIEREGSKKTGHYIIKDINCEPNNCQVCAKSPLCTQFQQIDKSKA